MKKEKSISNEISQSVSIQKKIFKIMLFGSVLLFMTYIYLVGSITFNIIARRSLNNTITVLTGQLNTLESTYLNSVNKIDKKYAYSLGYVDVGQNYFVTRSINHVAIR
jgi:hypothetical protein